MWRIWWTWKRSMKNETEAEVALRPQGERGQKLYQCLRYFFKKTCVAGYLESALVFSASKRGNDSRRRRKDKFVSASNCRCGWSKKLNLVSQIRWMDHCQKHGEEIENRVRQPITPALEVGARSQFKQDRKQETCSWQAHHYQ